MVAADFVVIGDTHLAPGPRQGDKLAALEQILQHGRALEHLAGWLWPGDLFHATSTIADRNALKEIVKRMANAAPVIICYGNHDAPGDLDIFADLAAHYRVVVVSQPQVVRVDTPAGGEVAVFALPYPHKGQLVGAGVAHDDLGAAARHALEPVFLAAAHDLATAQSDGAVALVMGHINIGGASASTGQPQIGREIELDPSLLARFGAIPKVFNHIHLPQELHGAYIPGSIAAMDFGEMEAKRFLVIEYRRSSEGAWSHSVVSHPLAVAAQYHVEGALTREGFVYAVKAGPGGETCPTPASWKGADVRVRCTYRRSEYSALQRAHVDAEFAEVRSLKVEMVPLSDTVLRAPEVVAAISLTDKLERYCALSGVPWTDALAGKVDALQQIDAEVLIARWHDRPAPAFAETAVA